jgi:hypothetical protein
MPLISEGHLGTVVVDDRYAPLIVTTFIGQVELDQGMWFERTIRKLIHEQYALGSRIVNIHDATRSSRTTPEMRKFWAEMSSRNEQLLEAKTLSNPIVVGSAMLRGVITAVGWLNPRVAKLEVFPTLTEAIAASVELLKRSGSTIQLSLAGYELPPGVRPARVAT